MEELKKKAIEKLDKELGEEPQPMERVLADWLKQQDEEELLKGILEPKKTIQQAKQYAYNKANEIQVGGCAIVEEQLLYLWIMTYYKEPMIVLDNKGKKNEAKKPTNTVKEKPKSQCINSVKKTSESTQEKNKTQMMEGEQLDLLSFI